VDHVVRSVAKAWKRPPAAGLILPSLRGPYGCTHSGCGDGDRLGRDATSSEISRNEPSNKSTLPPNTLSEGLFGGMTGLTLPAGLPTRSPRYEWLPGGGKRYVKLVICDNQRILAEALAAALDARGHQVLGVTTTVTDGLRAVTAGRPDVCLLDVQFGDELDGLDAVRAIRQSSPGTRVVVLSAVTDLETLTQVISSGVAGFIGKDKSVDQIASALDVISAGGTVLNSVMPWVRARGTVRSPRNPLDELSPREKEIVARIVEGQSTRQMAFAMNITVGTVRTYVKNVLAKLGAHSRLQLAAVASRSGWLCRRRPDLLCRQRFMCSSLTSSVSSTMLWRSGCVLRPT
jgi:two-component system, NarL family, nitrate/nitrite response regulator NarL